jgi:hypothetical protein
MEHRQRKGLLAGFGERPKQKAKKSRQHQTRGAPPQSGRDSERRGEDQEWMEQIIPGPKLVKGIVQKEDALIERRRRAVKPRQKDEQQCCNGRRRRTKRGRAVE